MVFRNINFFGEATERRQVRENLIWFLREQLLNFGAYYNMDSGQVDSNGVSYSKLYPSYQPEYTGNNPRFWKGRSNHWVWESGVSTSFSGSSPIASSGIYVAGSFVPISSTGSYTHYIDYLRGGIVLSTGVASGTSVECYRTERAAFVYSADSEEMRRLNLDSLKAFREQTKYPVGSGYDAAPPEYSVNLPALFIDVNLKSTKGYELGDSLQWRNFNISIDVVSQNIDYFDVLQDICTNLEGQAFNMFDVQDTVDAGKYPLDYLGRKKSDALIRSQLVSTFPWRRGRFLEDSKIRQYPNILPLRRCTITIGFEVIL